MMSGWDHDFDVDTRDVDLLRDCLRVLRRTCARHRIEFSYYEDRSSRVSPGRRRFVLAYDLQSVDAPLAASEFVIEMRALSTVQRGSRRKRLPLRLMRDFVWVNSPEAPDQQFSELLVAEDMSGDVSAVIERYQAVYSAYARGEVNAADFLESQHSFVIDLALLIAQGASATDDYPTLVKKLIADPELASAARQIGSWRNKVKHRGQRDLAAQVVDIGANTVWSISRRLTGAYPDPVSPAVRVIERDPAQALRLPQMLARDGSVRRPSSKR